MNKGCKILLALFVFPAIVFAQKTKKDNASIKGNIKGLKDNEVYISYHEADKAKTDTVAVKEGKFMWSGKIADPQKVYIGTKQRYMELFMENSPVTVTGNIDSFYYSTVKGSAVHDEYKAFGRSIKGITDVEDDLYQKLYDLRDGSEADKAIVEKQIDSMRTIRRGKMMDYISAHPSSPVSVNMVEDMAMMGEFSTIDSLYKMLSSAAQQTTTGKRLGKRIDILRRSAMGAQITDFVQADVNGKPVKIADYRGKYVFIDFWASWCGPCRAENPNVLKAYNTFKDKNFTVLGISLDDKADKWKEAIEKDGMPWVQVSDLKGFNNEVSSYYGIQAIPYSFLIDPNGKIIEKGLRGAELHSKLAEILQ
jgi:peroxiredoxin